jgi:hypothetical protein
LELPPLLTLQFTYSSKAKIRPETRRVMTIKTFTLSRCKNLAIVFSLIASVLSFVPTPANAVVTCAPEVIEDNTYTILKFTNTGTCTWEAPTGTTSMQGLIVGGGGGGGGDMGGGGGGGGYLEFQTLSVTSQVLTISVGAGGAGAIKTEDPFAGNSGGNSSISGTGISLISLGGAGGASRTFADNAPARSGGGSGGGGSGGEFSGATNTNSLGNQSSQTQSPLLSTIGGNQFGNDGSPKVPRGWSPGGGGGAGAAGTRAPGHGGAGRTNSILGTSFYWAGGGGGSGNETAGGDGGAGGGGAGGAFDYGSLATGGSGLNSGSPSPNGANGGDGGANTGGGGGGGSWKGFTEPKGNAGGNGGSGIVVLKYLQVSNKVTISQAAVGTQRRAAFTTQPEIRFQNSANTAFWMPFQMPGHQIISILNSFRAS